MEEASERCGRSSYGHEPIELTATVRALGSLGQFSCGLAERVGPKIEVAAAMVRFDVAPRGYHLLWYADVDATEAPVSSW